MGNIRASSHAMGHPIIYVDGEWFIKETGELCTDEATSKLACVKCGLLATKDGHDPCISNLPDVDYACCGHGLSFDKVGYQIPYIKYTDGNVVRFNTTEELLKHVGR